MAAVGWRVSVCVVTLLVLCGSVFGSAAKKGKERGRYIHGHPLLDGSGARGRHLYGYDRNQEQYRPSPKFNHHFKNFHSDNYRYGPYDSYLEHQGHGYHSPYHGQYDYPYEPEYHHRKEEYNDENQYPDHGGYKVYSRHDYPNPHHRYGYFPFPYDYSYYPSSAEQSASAEAEDMMKAVDEEIHATKPQDKVLYEQKPRDSEEQGTRESKIEKKPVIKVEELMKEPGRDPEVEEVEEVSEYVPKVEEVEIPEEPESESESEPEAEPEYVDESVDAEMVDEGGVEPEAEEGDNTVDNIYQTSDDYSGYTYGYAGTAPLNLVSTFCVGQADGNFANPGLTKKADPRCTYVTCAGNRTILFNCAPGTFNGRFLEYHLALWSHPSADYKNAPHVRFEAFGQDFCGQLDVGSVTNGPVCTTSKRVPEVRTEDAATQEDTYSDNMAQDDEAQDTSQEVAGVYSTDMGAQEQPEQYTSPEGREIEETQISEDQERNPPTPVVDTPMEEPEIPEAPEEDAPEVQEYVPDESAESEVDVSQDDAHEVNVPEIDDSEVDVPEVNAPAVNGPELDAPEYVPEEEEEDISEVESTQVLEPGFEEPEVDGSAEDDIPPVDLPLAASVPEGKSLVQGSLSSDDYSNYKAGYGGAPEVLDNDFCVNMEDGNFANPGLTPNVDPRCTYVTCSAEQTFVFSCPLGTFNGATYKHHYPHYGLDVLSHATAHHYRYAPYGFCAKRDYKGLCSR